MNRKLIRSCDIVQISIKQVLINEYQSARQAVSEFYETTEFNLNLADSIETTKFHCAKLYQDLDGKPDLRKKSDKASLNSSIERILSQSESEVSQYALQVGKKLCKDGADALFNAIHKAYKILRDTYITQNYIGLSARKLKQFKTQLSCIDEYASEATGLEHINRKYAIARAKLATDIKRLCIEACNIILEKSVPQDIFFYRAQKRGEKTKKFHAAKGCGFYVEGYKAQKKQVAYLRYPFEFNDPMDIIKYTHILTSDVPKQHEIIAMLRKMRQHNCTERQISRIASDLNVDAEDV